MKREKNTADILNERRRLGPPLSDDEAQTKLSSSSRRSFLVAGLAAVAGLIGWRALSDETKYALYQRFFRINEGLSRTLYSADRLAPEFDRSQVSPPRVNGFAGLDSEIDLSAWRLAVGGLAGRSDDLLLTLDDLKRLPRVEMTTELKCIEGWSVIVHWAGVRFSDFAARYAADDTSEYVSISTPDDGYFVGWDKESLMHPQSLLAYEMNGAPLTLEHGAPLRIASTTKYGIKLIKRIGRIEFTSVRPRDFWALAENGGYDWYSGH